MGELSAAESLGAPVAGVEPVATARVAEHIS
jgi:hypothetical protein